jgi:hypothetical protein
VKIGLIFCDSKLKALFRYLRDWLPTFLKCPQFALFNKTDKMAEKRLAKATLLSSFIKALCLFPNK